LRAGTITQAPIVVAAPQGAARHFGRGAAWQASVIIADLEVKSNPTGRNSGARRPKFAPPGAEVE